MATVKKMVKKAQSGDSLSKKKPYDYKADSAAKKPYYKLDVPEVREKPKNSLPKSRPASIKAKAKSGGSFPDLNKDGKITKADILKGRGVIAKKGAKVSAMKKCKYGCK